MPWMETSPMEQRERFIRDHRLNVYRMSELCARYDISRKTGYKWLARFHEEGRRGLGDRSRAPHQCPHCMSAVVAELICHARRQHPSWGPEKRVDWLAPRHPDLTLPAVSTPGDLLARRGLVKKRRRRRRYQHPGVVPAITRRPNDLWTADFKGHFRTRDGINVWWMRLGIQHQRILPAHPQQNGAHERMHETLKGEAIRPPRDDLRAQQREFHTFRHVYNHDRPRQALRGQTPASLYQPSPRAYTDAPPIQQDRKSGVH